MVVSGSGLSDLVKLLLHRGANIEAKNSDGSVPLIMAAHNSIAKHFGYSEISRLLKSKIKLQL